jgi:hypothetical protein
VVGLPAAAPRHLSWRTRRIMAQVMCQTRRQRASGLAGDGCSAGSKARW